MNKEMTPMKRFSTNMQTMRSELKNYFTELTLNKAQPKYHYRGYGDSSYSAGVENDFIIIFSDKANAVSFALAFSYIGISVDKQTVVASIKKGDSNEAIVGSQPLSLLEFKNHINQFNHWLKDNPMIVNKNTSYTILDKFSEIFMTHKVDIKAQVDKKEKEIEEFIINKTQELNIPELKEKALQSNAKLDKANEVVKNSLEKTDEFQELQALKKRATFLEKMIKLNEANLKVDNSVAELEKKAKVSNKNLLTANTKLKDMVEAEKKNAGTVIAKRIKLSL